MDVQETPKITSAERMDGGVFIAFDNDKAAIYSASVLYAAFSQAKEVLESDIEDEARGEC